MGEHQEQQIRHEIAILKGDQEISGHEQKPVDDPRRVDPVAAISIESVAQPFEQPSDRERDDDADAGQDDFELGHVSLPKEERARITDRRGASRPARSAQPDPVTDCDCEVVRDRYEEPGQAHQVPPDALPQAPPESVRRLQHEDGQPQAQESPVGRAGEVLAELGRVPTRRGRTATPTDAMYAARVPLQTSHSVEGRSPRPEKSTETREKKIATRLRSISVPTIPRLTPSSPEPARLLIATIRAEKPARAAATSAQVSR